MYEVRRDPIPGADVRRESFGTPSVVFDWRAIVEDGKLRWACNPSEDDRDIAEDWVASEGLGKKWNGRIVEVDAPSDVAIPQSRRAPLDTLQTVYDAVEKLGEQNKARILAGIMPSKEPEWAKPIPAAVREFLKVSPWPEAWKLGEDGRPLVVDRIVEKLVEVERAPAAAPAETKPGDPAKVPGKDDLDPPKDDAGSLSKATDPATLALLATYGTPLKIERAIAVIRARLAELGDVDLKIEQANHLLKKADLPPATVKTFPALLQAAKE